MCTSNYMYGNLHLRPTKVQRLKHSGGDGETSVVVLWDHGGISDYRIKAPRARD